jgi:hypothetical protein
MDLTIVCECGKRFDDGLGRPSYIGAAMALKAVVHTCGDGLGKPL